MKKFLILTCGALAVSAICVSAASLPAPGVSIGASYQTSEWDSANHYYPFVMYDESAKDYKMYYSASTRAETNDSMWGQRIMGMKVSKDAVSWTAPNNSRQPVLYARKLMQGEILNPDDAKTLFDSVYAIGPCVIKDGNVYKMWYTGWDGETELAPGAKDGRANKINFRIGYATSPDGIHWTKRPGKAGSGSVLGLGTEVKNDFHGYGQPDYKGAGQPFVIKEGLTYRMWYEGFDGRVWRIFYAVSNDGVKWDAKGALLNGGSRGSLDELGLRNPVVIKRKGEYELWYQGRSGGLPNYHVLRATSPNGIGWTKIQGEVTLHPPSPVTKNEEIFVDSILVQPDGSCQVFYSKENTTISQASDGGINESKRFANYMEVVNP